MTAADAPLRAVLRRPFPEQIAAYRLRLGNLVPTQAWDDLWQDAHDRAFMVAGAMKADLLADLALSIDKAIAQGTSLEEFRRDFRAAVVRRGWHGWTGDGTRAGEAWRTRVIYRTNAATSYAAGRMAQLREAGFRFWVYRHGGSREPRPIHLALDGLILPSDHPFWDVWAPPNGWGCSCWVAGAHTLRAAQRRGGNPDVTLPEDWADIDPRTGAPAGIDRGWAYAPGASTADAITLAAAKATSLPPPLADDFARSLDAVIDRAWSAWSAAALAGARSGPALIGTVSAEVRAAIAAPSAASPVALTIAPEVLRAGPATAWPQFPARLRSPVAVLSDRGTGALLYVLPDEAGIPIWVVRVQPGEGRGEVRSVEPADVAALVSQVAAGLLALVVGALA